MHLLASSMAYGSASHESVLGDIRLRRSGLHPRKLSQELGCPKIDRGCDPARASFADHPIEVMPQVVCFCAVFLGLGLRSFRRRVLV
jgi:hypothetical protein